MKREANTLITGEGYSVESHDKLTIGPLPLQIFKYIKQGASLFESFVHAKNIRSTPSKQQHESKHYLFIVWIFGKICKFTGVLLISSYECSDIMRILFWFQFLVLAALIAVAAAATLPESYVSVMQVDLKMTTDIT